MLSLLDIRATAMRRNSRGYRPTRFFATCSFLSPAKCRNFLCLSLWGHSTTKVNKLQQRSTESNKSQQSTTTYDSLRQSGRVLEEGKRSQNLVVEHKENVAREPHFSNVCCCVQLGCPVSRLSRRVSQLWHAMLLAAFLPDQGSQAAVEQAAVEENKESIAPIEFLG